MSNHVIWASGAQETDVQAPPAEKQVQGWTKEAPPHEWFNWYMNRTDTRLSQLEEPQLGTSYTSFAGTRGKTIAAGEKFTLPVSYIVGADNLRVYLDGIRCYPGEDQQYMEAGSPGTYSNYIRWNDAIPDKYDISVDIPVKGQDKVALLTGTVTMEELTQQIASALANSKFQHVSGGSREYSPGGSRPSVLVVGSSYTVPQYEVGSNKLFVTLKGLLCTPGVEYLEVGTPGSMSTTIAWTTEIPTEASINAYTYDSHGRIDSPGDTRAAVIPAGTEFTVPRYIVGSKRLMVCVNGLLCTPGVEYHEIGDLGTASTTITWTFDVEVNLDITAYTFGEVQAALV